MNLLSNPSCEGGWTRKTHTGQEFGEIFVPEGWTAYWKEGGSVPHDPENPNGYGRPEMHVINLEPPFLNPLRIYNGTRALKFFTFFRIHDAGIYQQVDTVPGTRLTATGWAHAWSAVKDSPITSDIDGDGAENFTFRVGIDPYGGTDPWADSVIWGAGAHIYDVFEQIPTLEVLAQANKVTMFVRSTVLYPFKHCDAYVDDLRLEDSTEPPPPPPVACYPVIEKGTKLTSHGTGESGTYNMLIKMRDAGSPLPFCKILAPQPKNLLAIRNLKFLSPTTKFIARLMNGSDPYVNMEGLNFELDPQVYMNSILPSMREYPEVDYWELWNEEDPPGKAGHVAMAEYSIECMDIAEAEGFKLALLSNSTGVPENPEWQAIWNQTGFFQRAKAGGHILSLHAYCRWIYPEEWASHLLRPKWLYENILIPNDCVVPFIFTEYNMTEIEHGGIWDHPEYPKVYNLLEEYRTVDQTLSEMFYCLGATLYQFGAGDDRYCIDKIWSEICDIMLLAKDRQNALPQATDGEEGYHRYVIMADPTYMTKEQLDMAYLKGRAALQTVTPSWNDAVQEERPAEWLSNTVDAGPLPAIEKNKYLSWVWDRDADTDVVFDDAPKGFRQGDPRWAGEPLGSSVYTMRSSGCLVTVYAEWMLRIDPEMTPLKLVQWLNQNNGFTSVGNLYLKKPQEMTGGFELVSYADSSLAAIREATSPILKVDYDPGDEDIDSHFVMLVQDLGDDMLVMDPWYGEVVSLMSLYGRGTLEQSIFAMIELRLTTRGDEEDLPLLGFNDPENQGAYEWLNQFNGKSLVVVPIFLTGGPTELHFDPTKVRVIVNLRYSHSTDLGGGGTLPMPGPLKQQFVAACIGTIKNSTGVWGWTVGNEANNPREFPHAGVLTPTIVADTYNAIRAGVPAGVRMSPGALDPFHASAGCPSVWLRQIYERISGAEFVAVHGYIRGPNSELVLSTAKFTDDPLKWQGLNYVECVTALLTRGLPVAYNERPVYVTEFNHIWQTSEAVGDLGWVHDQRAADVVAAGYGVALAHKMAGLAIYRWSGDQWAVEDNLTVLNVVRRLVEEIQPC